ncbi:Arrestin-C domain-containing protein [Mycena indigotica]|uniref:Arrestin-C domain-containing protein n=1 Tax=Mycena indigotica TaxID=2126181 RepID=A0A8H6WC83_9AGAR|nr:Arrestin-C domain-containing protein [Mycena indigotica]KAF7309483.1 Arrestin-C domain-containing protein [Mycena indigotica]
MTSTIVFLIRLGDTLRLRALVTLDYDHVKTIRRGHHCDMHFFRPKTVDEQQDSQRMEIAVDHDFLFLRGTGSDSEPALLQGNVVLELREPTTVRSITLQFRGKAYVAQPPQQDSLSSGGNPTSTYVVCKHNWSFLEGAKKNSYTLKAGRHLFPFKLQLGGSLPSSLVTDAMGGASVSYKLRAVAQRTGLSHNIQAVAPIYLIRSLAPTALEYQQTRDIEYTWMNKLLFYIAIPHVAWAAGDELVALLKITPLVKGVGVLSITTTLRETTKLHGRQGSHTRKVATVVHEILGGTAVQVVEHEDRKDSRFSLASRVPTPSSQPVAGPSRLGDTTPSPPNEPSQGEDDVVTTLKLPIPSQCTPSHSQDPVNVSYVVHWSVLVTNADGHISELFCSLPITILDSYLLNESRSHTTTARQLLVGHSEPPSRLEDKSELPSYMEHVRDRVANMALSEANTLRVTNPWVQMGVSPIIVDGQRACPAPLEVIADHPFISDPNHPLFLDWVNAELLISQGATRVTFPTNAEVEGSGHNTPIPHPEHPSTPTTVSAEGIATYTHPSHASNSLRGIFTATLEPVSSFSHPAWLSTRPDPKTPRNLSSTSLSSAETLQRRVREVAQPVPNVNSELLHRAFTEVPDYEIAVKGFLGGVPPLSSMHGLPSYSDSEGLRHSHS